MKKLLALSLVLALGLSGCSAAQPVPTVAVHRPLSVAPAHSPEADRALAELGLDLVKAARTGKGTLVSPLSLALALSMAANGAQGETLDQLTAALAGEGGLDELNAACAEWIKTYSSLGGSTKSSLANSLWVDPEGMVREDFVGRCQGVFQAQVFRTQLSDAALVDQLNGWIGEQTQGMIPDLVSQPFDENVCALLVNALYLENRWVWEFDPNATGKLDFYSAQGGRRSIDFLRAAAAAWPSLQTGDAQGVILPYDDDRLGFFALMPDGELGPWLEDLDGAALIELIQGAEKAQFLSLALPKFEAEWQGDLSELLPGLGLDLAFDPAQADFSALGEHPGGYYISKVIHAAKLKVNEKGTQAAAATVVAAPAGAAPPQEGIALTLDRPFLYGVVDLETGLPLFLGTFE